MGPNFLNAIIGNNNCSSFIQLPTVLHSYEDFCAIFNCATQRAKECLIDAAARINIDLSGIIKFSIVLGKCCRYCSGKAANFGFFEIIK